MIDIKQLSTESSNKKTSMLDEMSTKEIISVMNDEDFNVPRAINKQLSEIEMVVNDVVNSFKNGGRLFYVGAGTSGRLGILDAAECVPTFGTDPSMVQGVIAGGEKAITLAVEGAEDDGNLAKEDLKIRNLNKNDVVVGIAASGRTPYVIGAIDYANEIGASTASLACNKDSVIGKHAKNKIEIVVGPEILSGSTRLKSGTAQKLVLNMISTASMVLIGKTYGNLMVDVKPTNKKLIQRSVNIISEVTKVSESTALQYLKDSHMSVKDAIVMISNHQSLENAREALNNSDGFVRRAIK